MIHAFTCFRIDYCNSLLIGFFQGSSFTSAVGPKCGGQFNSIPATTLSEVYPRVWTTTLASSLCMH